jgi:hypothetical protein
MAICLMCGGTRQVSSIKDKICGSCGATGMAYGCGDSPCTRCSYGYIRTFEKETCPACNGRGETLVWTG